MFGNNSFGNTSFGNTTFGAGFGTTPTLGAFGSTTQTTTQPAGPVGTTIRFVPLTGTDTVQKTGSNTGPSQITTRHQIISAMKEYESKSVDELRLEDYAANRKVGQPQTAFNSTPFGTMQPSTSQQNTSIFGGSNQPSTNLFATPTQNQTTNIFGQPKTGFELNNSPNIFSSSLSKPSTTVSSSPFNIGTPFNTNTSTFGAMQPSTSQQNTSIFGSSNQPATNLFATPTQNQTTNIFGQPKTGFELNNSSNIFSSSLSKPTTTVSSSPFNIGTPFNTNTSTFGTMQPSTSQQNTSIFGSSNQPATNLFATPTQNQATSIFGQPKTGFELNKSSNIFSSSLSKPSTTVSSSPFNIGTPFNTNTSTFGTMQPSTSQQNTSIFGSSNQPSTNLFATPTQNQTTSIFGQPKTGFELNNSSNLFSSPLNKPSTTVSSSPFTLGTISNTNAPTSVQSAFPSFNNNNSQATPFGSSAASPFKTNIFAAPASNTGSIFNTTANNSSGFVPLQQPAQQPQQQQQQQLQKSPDLLSNRLKTLPYGETSLFLNDSNTGFSSLKFTTDPKTINQYKMNAKTNVKLNKPSSSEKPRASSVLFDDLDDGKNDILKCAIDVFVPKKSVKRLEIKPTSQLVEGDADHSQSFRDSTLDGEGSPSVRFAENNSFAASDVSSFNNNSSLSRSCISNTRLDYKIVPSLEEIERRYNSERDTCIIDSLLIERPNYGSIFFDSPLDVKGINFDEIVHIGRKEVVVYPDDDVKPPVGQGLNRPAIVTLHQVWPIDKSTSEVIRDIDRLKSMRYPKKVESATIEKGARFIDYKPETGSWVFQVEHFSKYNITDDDEEEEDEEQQDDQVQREQEISHSNYSMRVAIDELSEDEDKQSFVIHRTKRLALQNVSPNVRSASICPYEKPIIVGATVPKQQRIREIKPKPDLCAAKNKMIRDIMSVKVSGSPKVRFFNGSRLFCVIQGDTVAIQELKLVPTNNNGTLACDIEERLETFLETNSLVTSLNMSPTLAPYIETYDYISNAFSHDLLYAMHGKLNSKTPYAKQDERLNRVINWLATVNQKLTPPTNLYQLIIYHMSCDRYDLACKVAIDHDHPRLALLVATLNLNKDLMFEQLSSWRLSTADQYIDPELLKIYILLSGLTEWKLSNDVTIYCLKDLEWTQQLCLLALHFTSFVTEPDKYGFHMLPLYIKRLDTNTNDVDYHIIARHSPATIISAAATLIDEWFLLESLKSFHVINTESECMESDIIHCNLAAQLGPIDLRWACFIALHIINNEVRNQVLIQCLEQNHNQFKEEKQNYNKTAPPMTVETWLVEKLRLPSEFIENAKSLAER